MRGWLCDRHPVISIGRVSFGWSLLVVAKGTCRGHQGPPFERNSMGVPLSCVLLLVETTISAERRMQREETLTVYSVLWERVLYVGWFWVSPRTPDVWAQSKFTDKLWHTDSVTLMAAIWKSIITNIDCFSKSKSQHEFRTNPTFFTNVHSYSYCAWLVHTDLNKKLFVLSLTCLILFTFLFLNVGMKWKFMLGLLIFGWNMADFSNHFFCSNPAPFLQSNFL